MADDTTYSTRATEVDSDKPGVTLQVVFKETDYERKIGDMRYYCDTPSLIKLMIGDSVIAKDKAMYPRSAYTPVKQPVIPPGAPVIVQWYVENPAAFTNLPIAARATMTCWGVNDGR